ncbi:MAG: flavodoxin family protein [Steroidobacteraceae bacterium]
MIDKKAKSTVALFASAGREGNTGRLIDRVSGELKLEVVDLTKKNIAPYTYDHRHRGDDFEPLMTHLLACEQIVFASPVYWYSMSPPMKIFLDRISDYLELPDLLSQGRRLRGKTGFVLCTSVMEAPAPEFISAFQQTFEYLGMHDGGHLHANCADGYLAEKYESDTRKFLRHLRAQA